jgi:hypothetical protein
MSWTDLKPEEVTERDSLRLVAEQAMRIAERLLLENEKLKADNERLLLAQRRRPA